MYYIPCLHFCLVLLTSQFNQVNNELINCTQKQNEVARTMADLCGAAVSWVLVSVLLLLVSREALSLRHRLLPKTVHNSAPVQGYNYQTRFFDQKV